MNNLRLPWTAQLRYYSRICINTAFVSLQKPVPVHGIASTILNKNSLVPETPAFAFIQNQQFNSTYSSIFQKQQNMKHQFSILAAPFHTSSSLQHGRKFAMERRQKKASQSSNRCNSSGGASITESDSRSEETPDKKVSILSTGSGAGSFYGRNDK